MTNSGSSQASQYVKQALQALRQNDHTQARLLAAHAAQLAPETEEPWLILAAAGSPKESLKYFNRALQVNPASQRARQGIHWAVKSLRGSQATIPTTRIPSVEETGPIILHKVQASLEHTGPIMLRPAKTVKKKTSQPWLLLVPAAAVILLVMIGLVAWIVLPNNWVVFGQDVSAPKSISAVLKPSLTPSATATSTFTPTPTQTPTSTFTATFTPTPKPTNTPRPTNTRIPPTVAPRSVQPAQPSGGKIPSNIQANQRWVDVNLSAQTAYAYEGNQVVRSFLVSTGVAAHPTVTGQYHIYVKYRYANMKGPGYNLPNVPYVMYFYQGYGLHGTYWHHNFGHPMSHGCVNLSTPDAGWLFNWASVGTLVNIHY
ncbi:MAG: L,D-transpeptidase [Anaerolineaceae bacterium]|nr:L,D-transpeptidase [Anaerolineaceae bacterium]